jgi:hypothetical protein
MSQYVSVSWPAPSCPVWALISISPPGVKAEARNHEKDMAASSVNGNPASGAAVAVFPKLIRGVWCLQPSDRVQNIRGRSGAIVSRIVKRLVPSSITVRPANDLISRGNRLSHNRRCLRRSNRVPKFCSSGSSRDIMIDVRCSGLATRKDNDQTQPTENSTKIQHGPERATNRSRNSRS